MWARVRLRASIKKKSISDQEFCFFDKFNFTANYFDEMNFHMRFLITDHSVVTLSGTPWGNCNIWWSTFGHANMKNTTMRSSNSQSIWRKVSGSRNCIESSSTGLVTSFLESRVGTLFKFRDTFSVLLILFVWLFWGPTMLTHRSGVDA